MDQGTASQIIAQASDVQLWRFLNNERKRISFGSLYLATLPQNQQHFLNIDTLYQNIQGLTLVFLDFPNQVNLIFPHFETGLNVLSMIKKEDSQLFLQQLQQISLFVPYDQAIQNPQFREIFQTHCRDIQEKPIENEGTTIHYIQKTGETLKTGFTWLGGVIGSGISKGSDYISSKVEKKEDLKISDETKGKVDKVKSTISTSWQVTSALVNQYVINPLNEKGGEMKQKINDHIDKSDNSTLKDARKISIATWQAGGQALSGLGSAAGEVGSKLGQGTAQIVQKKYGDEPIKVIVGENQHQQQQ